MPTIQVWIPDAELPALLRAAKKAGKKAVGAWLVELGRREINDKPKWGRAP